MWEKKRGGKGYYRESARSLTTLRDQGRKIGYYLFNYTRPKGDKTTSTRKGAGGSRTCELKKKGEEIDHLPFLSTKGRKSPVRKAPTARSKTKKKEKKGERFVFYHRGARGEKYRYNKKFTPAKKRKEKGRLISRIKAASVSSPLLPHS